MVSKKGKHKSEKPTEAELPDDIYNLTIALMHESNCTNDEFHIHPDKYDKTKDKDMILIA